MSITVPQHTVLYLLVVDFQARFAVDCLLKMKQVTRRLEVTLGPDTGDLSMRFGMVSFQS